MEQAGTSGGFSVLDLAALVMGSAIASIHVLRIMREDLPASGWIMICLVFSGVTVTAAGPLVFLRGASPDGRLATPGSAIASGLSWAFPGWRQPFSSRPRLEMSRIMNPCSQQP